jgi:hypothetical protein
MWHKRRENRDKNETADQSATSPPSRTAVTFTYNRVHFATTLPKHARTDRTLVERIRRVYLYPQDRGYTQKSSRHLRVLGTRRLA